MKKLVILQFDGNFSTGYKVTLEVGDEGKRPDLRIRGELPPAIDVIQSFQEWRQIYISLYGQSRIKVVGKKNINAALKQQCNGYSKKLLYFFNRWLQSESLNPINNCLSELSTKPEQELRIILSSDCQELRKLPWHLWNLHSGVEVSLSAPDAVRGERLLREKIRILIVLGDSTGINVKADEMLLQQYCRDAEIVTLIEPLQEQLHNYLQDELGWDILFFSGHSQTLNLTNTSERRTIQGRIFINKKDSLTIAQLRDNLQTAIQKRLQLAIFNSCDGLGIASELESLQIPQVIVMREPVPDLVAQEFLKYYLEAFTNGSSLCRAVGYARKQLEMLEEEFPCASWLPVIVQNQLEMPPTWQSLGITRSPYRGLMAFREEDAQNFFGREAFVEQLLIDVACKPLVTVIGASGSGKSSVVFAGLVPKLRQDTNRQWQIISFRPGKNPFESLAVALMGSRGIGENQRSHELELEVELKRDTSALTHRMADMFSDGSRVLLIVDQFEEIYTLCPNAQERQFFIDGLLNVCTGSQAFSTTIVITLRADFLGKAISYQPLGKALQDFPPSLLAPMNRAELERAITQPAARFSVELEEGLVNKLIDDVGSGEGSLPLQQFALTQLWKKQRPGLLTHQAYSEIGGVTQALTNHADAVYASLNEEEQKKAPRIFIQLVQPGEGTEDTRRLATRDEVGEDNWDLVTLLANERLLVTNRNELVEDTVEIVHEALIRNWGRLQGWMDDNREFRTWQERLKVALQQWVDSNKDNGGLLRGAPLAVAEDWLQKRGEEVSKPQRLFIEKSVDLRERERKEKERELQEALIRETSAQLIAGNLTVEKLFVSHLELEALIEAVKTAKKLQQSSGVQADIRMQTVATLMKVVYGVRELNRLEYNNSDIISVSFSSDSNTILSAEEDGEITIWNKSGRKLRSFKSISKNFEDYNVLINVSFSPDGNMIASAREDGTIKLWSKDGKELQTFVAQTAGITSVIFNPDGNIIASASEDGTIKLWDKNGKELQTFIGHNESVRSVTFSPDGNMIASASDDETVKLWDKNGKELQTLVGHNGGVNSVSFSPDGNTIASASDDETVKLWDKNGKELQTFVGHNRGVSSVSFSPDGNTIASASYDKTVKLWNKNGKELKTFNGHRRYISSVSFSSDSTVIASASDDETIRLWSKDGVNEEIYISPNSNFTAINFSPDSNLIVCGNDDGKIELWRKDGIKVHTFKGHTGTITSIIFSPDGATIASSSYNGEIKLWTKDGKKLRTIKGHSEGRISLSFSRDGKTITSANDKGEIKIWKKHGKCDSLEIFKDKYWIRDICFSRDSKTIGYCGESGTIHLFAKDEKKLLQPLIGHTGTVASLCFSPDNNTIVSGGLDTTIKLWSKEGTELRTLKNHYAEVTNVSFSPDGNTIASASYDGTVKLWSKNGTELQTLEIKSSGLINSMMFSPNGKTLACVSDEGEIIMWNFDLGDLLKKACNWLHDYLQNNPNASLEDKQFCNDILMQ